jgi:hypothetical protein
MEALGAMDRDTELSMGDHPGRGSVGEGAGLLRVRATPPRRLPEQGPAGAIAEGAVAASAVVLMGASLVAATAAEQSLDDVHDASSPWPWRST